VSTYVAFIRAINVAGHASLRMTDVRDAFVAAGGRGVRTFIQSGNVIFGSSAREVTATINDVKRRLADPRAGEPEILCRSVRQIQDLVTRAPFKVGDAGPRLKLYVAFLARKPRLRPVFPLVNRKEALEAVGMTAREVFIVSRPKRPRFFGFPNNFIEDALDVPATTRNWSTITKIVTLVSEGKIEE
jgi:uncharacterized protein (DUF1697 family)